MPNSRKLLRDRKKITVAALSVTSNTLLVIGKLVIGWLIGSVSVISEAIHSGVDLMAALIAYFAVRTSAKPADRHHPFGHGKIENISGVVEAILIFLAAGWIVYAAVKKIIHPEPLEAVGWGVGIMLFSAALNFIISEMLFKVGRETDSMALQADGWHLRTDVWTSLGVMAGLGLIWVNEKIFSGLHFHWLDPAAAIMVALLIIRAAYRLTREAARDLMDASLSPEELAWIRALIIKHCPPVCGFHRLRTRKSGATRFVEFHLLVHSQMSVEDSHCLTDDLSEHIEKKFTGSSVTIHIEPCAGYCSKICRAGCLLTPGEQVKMKKGDA
ncbi:cation transporter [candidate division FCPU426 bacterium]|nr:cation transporter [candidate division FCPU426 bacterium]